MSSDGKVEDGMGWGGLVGPKHERAEPPVPAGSAPACPSCGHDMELQLVCEQCGQRVAAEDEPTAPTVQDVERRLLATLDKSGPPARYQIDADDVARMLVAAARCYGCNPDARGPTHLPDCTGTDPQRLEAAYQAMEER